MEPSEADGPPAEAVHPSPEAQADTQPGPRQVDQSTIDQALGKYLAGWGAAYLDGGLDGAIDAFYTALFEPEQAGEIPAANAFEGRLEELTTPLPNQLPAEAVPSCEEFKRVLLRTVNREADYGPTLKGEVPELMQRLADHGDLSVWSQGDNVHQAHKMRQTGIGDIRREIARSRGGDVRPHEVVSVIVGDKFQALSAPDGVLDQMRSQGQSEMLVFDDRRGNLDRLAQIVMAYNTLHGTNIKATLSWVRHGGSAEDLSEDEANLYHPVADMRQIAELAESRPKGIKILLDYDNTISDDQLRKQATLDAVADTLVQQGWIR